MMVSNAGDALMSIGAVGVKATMSHHFGIGTGRARRSLEAAFSSESPEAVRQPIDSLTAIEKQRMSETSSGHDSTT